MNPLTFLKPRPERETNLRRILAELDDAQARTDRMLAEVPARDTNARERLGDE